MLRVVFCVLVFTGICRGAHGQNMPRNRAAAADAYDRGTAAYLSGDYARAAGWFETAHRLSPAAAAIQQAIRAHLKAHDEARAATLALQLQKQYPNEPQFRSYADEVLGELTPKLVRVEVSCETCELSLGGKVLPTTTFFVQPPGPHSLTATFATGDVTKQVAGKAGTVVDIALEAPPPKLEPKVVAAPPPKPAPIALAVEEEAAEPVSPVITLLAAGLTAGAGLATAISGVAALRAGDEYDQALAEYGAQGCDSAATGMIDVATCQELHDEATRKLRVGENAELRTNVLLGATAVALAATTVLAAFFTDWDSGAEEAPTVTLGITPRGDAFGRMAVRF